MSKKRTLSLILAAMLALSACASGGETSDTQDPDTSSEATTTEAVLTSGVPEDYDLGGRTINVLNAPQYDWGVRLMNVMEETGDVINDAVYDRNMAVMEALGCNLNYIDLVMNKQTYIRASIMSGDSEFDCIVGKQSDMAQLVLEDMFLDLADAPYIDIEKPWWATNFIESVNIGKNNRYIIAGDISMEFIRDMGAVFYNKSLYEDYHGDPDAMYKTVLDGKWTADKVAELTKNVYADLNKNNEADENDRYGYMLHTAIMTDQLFYDLGAHATVIGSDGLPELDVANEHAVNVVEKIYSLFYDTDACFLTSGTEDVMPTKFAADESLFYFGLLYYSDYLREMESDYGVIPYPKYDESQENYKTLLHDGVPLCLIPVTTTDFDAASAVLEELAYQGWEHTTPAYYEMALKYKYMRDSSDTALMIMDMIRDSTFTEVGYVYNWSIDSAGLLIRNLMADKDKNLVSAWAAIETSANTKLDAIIEKYTAME